MPTTLKNAVIRYLRSGSPAVGTRKEYFSTLRKWTAWGGGVAIEKLTRREIRDFIDWVYERAVLSAIADPGESSVRVSDAPMQPMAADDVTAVLADVAVKPPANGILEVAGPERRSIAAFVGETLAASGDVRRVIGDPEARYYGAQLDPQGLTPSTSHPRITPTRLRAWLDRSVVGV